MQYENCKLNGLIFADFTLCLKFIHEHANIDFDLVFTAFLGIWRVHHLQQ